MTSPQNLNPYAPPRNATASPMRPLRLSHPFRRLCAWVVDAVFLFAVVCLTLRATMLHFEHGGDLRHATWFAIGVIAAGLMAVVVQCILLSRRGQTLGKLMLGMRIVRPNGERAATRRVVQQRYLLCMFLATVPVIGALLLLADSALILRASRRCLHDDIADTIVVDV